MPLSLLAPDSGEAVFEALRGSEVYFPESEARRAVTSGGTFNVLHPQSGGKVDIFAVPSEDAFTQSRIARRVRAGVLRNRDMDRRIGIFWEALASLSGGAKGN